MAIITTEKRKIDWARPDVSQEITIEDFKSMVKEAEQGEFYSLTELKQHVKQWRNRYEEK